jgi:hypothetical protein
MVDLTLQELKDVMSGVTTNLSNTRGDRNTLSKLEDIRKVLGEIHKQQSQLDLKAAAAQIGRAIVDSMNRQPGAGTSLTTQNFNVINDGVVRARRDLVQELSLLTNSFKSARTQIATQGPSGQLTLGGGQNFDDIISRHKAFQDSLTATGGKLSGFARGLDTASEIAKKLVNGISELAVALKGQFDQYRRLNNLGQTFGGDMATMGEIAHRSGMTLETFTRGMEQGSTALRQLGGRGFADVSLSLRASMEEMGNLGMSVQQVNSALGDYAEQMKYQGGLDQVRNATFNQEFQNMVRNTTTMSAAFGVARDQILKKASELAQDPRWATMLSNLDPEAQRRMTSAFAGLTPQAQKLMTDVESVIQGTPTQSAGVLAAQAPEMMAQLTDATRRFQAGQIDNTQWLEELTKATRAQQERRQDLRPLTNATGEAAQGMRENYVAIQQLAAGRVNNEGAALGDPNATATQISRWEASQEKIRGLQEHIVTEAGRAAQGAIVQFLKNESDAVDKYFVPVFNGMNSLAETLRPVDEAFKRLLETLGPEGTVLAHGAVTALAVGGGVVAAQMGGQSALRGVRSLTGARAAASAAQAATLSGAAAGAGTGAGGAAVGSAGAGAGAAGGAGAAAAKAARLARAGAVLKRLPGPLGLFLEGLKTYGDIQEAAADLAEGRITQAEFKKRLTEAVGRGLGGVGGMMIGGEIGALGGGAVGSVVPFLGTGVGAFVGGVGGAIAGAYGGEQVGGTVADMVMSSLSGPTQPTLPQAGQAPTTPTQANGSPPATPAVDSGSFDDVAVRQPVDPMVQLVDLMTRFSDEFHQQNLMIAQYQEDMRNIFVAIEENTESLNRNTRRSPFPTR